VEGGLETRNDFATGRFLEGGILGGDKGSVSAAFWPVLVTTISGHRFECFVKSQGFDCFRAHDTSIRLELN
jgi:hypothetical protein